MVRTFWFAVVVGGLASWGAARADGPAGLGLPRETRERVEKTVGRAVVYLQAESADWMSRRKCASCHHAGMAFWALAEADRQGYAVDRKFLADSAEATLGSRERMIASKLVNGPNDPPDPRPLGRAVNMGTVFMAVAAQSLPKREKGQDESLKFIRDEVVKKQQADGSWEFFLCRPPINETQASDAAWILMALQGGPGAGVDDPYRAPREKGLAWLASLKPPDDRQVKVLKALVALRGGEGRGAVQQTVDGLLAGQRPDGGWGQTAETKSDAFATGQTLYVLALAGYTGERPEVRRAVEFLVTTQKPDGSWPMTSRSSPDGKPGGSAKLLTPITCAASAWATLGLSRLAPKGP